MKYFLRSKESDQIYGSGASDYSIMQFYENYYTYEVTELDFPVSRSLDHTMGENIDIWAYQKLPMDILKLYIANEIPIEVHGIYPRYAELYCEIIGLKILKDLKFNHNPYSKPYNYIRPRFITAEKNKKIVLCVFVPSGKDYVIHYAAIIRHVISLLTKTYNKYLTTYRYPSLESSIAEWTHLDKSFVYSNDIVILGYVHEIRNILWHKFKIIEKVSRIENSFYESYRLKFPNGKIVNLLGVKYSFWGSISGELVSKICNLNVQEIIYAAKLGCLTHPSDIYKKIFSPKEYISLEYTNIKEKVINLRNKITERFPELDTGTHVSVPTVAEEDYLQRQLTVRLGSNSIDNEISQMAFRIQFYNKQSSRAVSFATLHFATDYLRRPQEKGLNLNFDLSNNRTEDAKRLKMKILDRVCEYLYKYIMA